MGYSTHRYTLFIISSYDLTILCKKSLKISNGNQNPYIEKEQTRQWPKEKGQKDKQRSTKHTYTTKVRVTPTPQKTGDELSCSGRVSSSCSTSRTRHVNLVTNPLISHEWGKDYALLSLYDVLVVERLCISGYKTCLKIPKGNQKSKKSVRLRVVVFNAIFSNISVISWRSVL